MRPNALPESLAETAANSVAPCAGEDDRAMVVAQASDENLNQWVAEILECAVIPDPSQNKARTNAHLNTEWEAVDAEL